MSRYEEWRRERDWRTSDRNRGEERDRDDERHRRSAFHPGNPGFEDNFASGRTAGGDDRQPYSQNAYGRYPGQQRSGGRGEEFYSNEQQRDTQHWGESESRYGQREPYNTRSYGGSRYSESQYGPGRGQQSQDRGGQRYGGGRSFGGDIESSFDRGSSFDRDPFGDTRDRPRYFGVGNYADGGASYGGGFDERQGPRPYGSLYGSERQHLEEQYRAPQRYRSGPKGYTRSDERLREEISERLMMADSIDASEVSVTVKDAKVTLEGTVPNRRMKHAIEDLADQCPGVQDVDNRIRVQREDWGSNSNTNASASNTMSASGATPTTTGSPGTTSGSKGRKE